MARRCLVAGWRPYDSRAIKRRQYFVSKYGSSIYIYSLFSMLLSMLLHIYSVLKALIFFSFVLRPAKHKRR